MVKQNKLVDVSVPNGLRDLGICWEGWCLDPWPPEPWHFFLALEFDDNSC